MAELHDPAQLPGAIVATHEEDQSLEEAQMRRNDGVVLNPANMNPWYVLATIHGEQNAERFDEKLHEKNKATWNQFCARHFRQFSAQTAKTMGISFDDVVYRAAGNLDTNVTTALKRRAGLELESLLDLQVHNLDGFYFPNGLVMKGFHFPFRFSLLGANLQKRFDVRGSFFEGDLSLSNTQLEGPAFFEKSHIKGQLEISKVNTSSQISGFEMTAIGGLNIDRLQAMRAYFDVSNFEGACEIDLSSVRYFSMRNSNISPDLKLSGRVNGRCSLSNTKVAQECRLEELYVSEDCDISGCEFGGYFGTSDVQMTNSFRSENVAFGGHVRLGPSSYFESAIFNGSTFKNRSNFSEAYFQKRAPRFFQTSLHDDTKFSLDPDHYPQPDRLNASEDVDAYGRLRHASKNNERPEAEHFFFRQEMRCKSILEGIPDRWFIKAYYFLSDFGFSVTRPLLNLVTIVVFFWPIIASFLNNELGRGANASIWEGLGVSFANTLPFLGLVRKMHPEFYDEAPWWLDAMSGAQSLTGIVLLFFFGLGLRNRFRLK